MNDFEQYLPNYQDYPEIAGEILPLGTFYEYVSSSFINGFLNCSKPIKAFLINRYRNYKENLKNAKIFNTHENYHADLFAIGDDILLLSKSESGEFWFFWMDHDVSDCCIGRFKTDDSDEQVIDNFIKHVHFLQKDIDKSNPNPIELDINKFTGWIKF